MQLSRMLPTGIRPRVPATTNSAAATDWRAPLKDLGHDLFNRQINLIITTGGMIGNSAPQSRQALRQIAAGYAECLRIKDPFAGSVSAGPGTVEELNVYKAAFKELKVKGDSPQERVPDSPADGSPVGAPAAADQYVLLRIADRTAVIANLLNGLTSSLDELTPREITTIQKIWEIGTDTIVMQTTISLGGDVVTRIHSGYTSSTNESIWRLHQQSVGASSSSWKDVVDAAIQLVQGLLGKL